MVTGLELFQKAKYVTPAQQPLFFIYTNKPTVSLEINSYNFTV